MEQALRVRPFAGVVLYAAAAEAFLRGNTSGWLELSRQLFCCSREYRNRLMNDLIGHAPPEEIQGMIEFIVSRFNPDLESLQALHAICASDAAASKCWVSANTRRSERRPRRAIAATRGPPSYGLLRKGCTRNCRTVRRRCCVRAERRDPNNYLAHYQLASCLIDQGYFDEAESHLRWCLLRGGDNTTLQGKMKEVIRGRLDSERRASARDRKY